MDTDVDVAVVGGGITGLTTALLLAEQGMRVAVLEARRLGNGTTGGTTGKVTSQHGVTYAALIEDHGEDLARSYAAANEAAKEEIADRASALDVDCEVRRLPAYIYARDDDERDHLRDELEVTQRLGLPARWDDAPGLPYEVAGALRFDDQVQFHSVRYIHGLARRVVELGGTVHENSRVVDVRSSARCRVVTEGGVVSADHTVLATLLPILDRGFEFARAFPSREYGISVTIAEEPPPGMYITAGSPTRSLRPAEGGADGNRLVVVGESHKTGHGDEMAGHLEALERFARRHFTVHRVEYRWAAQDYEPADGLPYIGRLSPTAENVHIATGLRKWGLTLGTTAAHVITDAIGGREHPLAAAFHPGRINLTSSAGKLIEENLEVARSFVMDRITDWGSLDDIPAGGGGLVVVDGERLAVSKDEQGQVSALRPICTHLGCVVSWNDAERSWDCPCHASRFTTDGEVIEGPATTALERRDI